jgi:hypothetical protein
MQRPDLFKDVNLSEEECHEWEKRGFCGMLRTYFLWEAVPPEEMDNAVKMVLDGQLAAAHMTTGLIHWTDVNLGNFGEYLAVYLALSSDLSCAFSGSVHPHLTYCLQHSQEEWHAVTCD